MFTPRKILRWDEAAMRDLNVMVDELADELKPETQGSVAAGQPGVQTAKVYVSPFYPGITVSGTGSFPTKVEHGLGVKPKSVTITHIHDGNTGVVELQREPDEKFIYLSVTTGTRKIQIRAEVE